MHAIVSDITTAMKGFSLSHRLLPSAFESIRYRLDLLTKELDLVVQRPQC
jgi:hypothetical protein